MRFLRRLLARLFLRTRWDALPYRSPDPDDELDRLNGEPL